ncbi:MAG: hypothetical protein ACN6O7_04580 [Sphingobacterium sp.]
MKRIICFTVGCLLFSAIYLQGCMNSGSTIEQREKESSGSIPANFDSLEHYLVDIDLFKIGELEDKKIKSEKEYLLLSALEDDKVDLSLLSNLKNIGYVRGSLDQSLYSAVDSLFFLKTRTDHVDTSCIYEFRDILVFYKNKQCIGIAKICFDCKAIISWSEKLNFAGFGDWKDYDKLHRLLKKK